MESIPNEILLNILSYLKAGDNGNLFSCRLVNQRWNELSSEITGKTISAINLSTRMEVICFRDRIQHSKTEPWFNKIRFALNTVPLSAIQKFASELPPGKFKIGIFPGLKDDSAPYFSLRNKLSDFLSNMEFITALELEPLSLNFPLETNPDSVFSGGFPTFQNLQTIKWYDGYLELLVCILKHSPSLKELKIKRWADTGRLHSFRHVAKVLESVPQQAKIGTEFWIYVQEPNELEYFQQILKYRNIFSKISFQATSDVYDNTTPWNPLVTQFLSMQSKSLKCLEICCKILFEIPQLEALQTLKLGHLAEPYTKLEEGSLPGLRQITAAQNLNILDLFATGIWPNVYNITLENMYGNAKDENELQGLLKTFPNMRKFSITVGNFLTFMKICRENQNSVTELNVYPWCEDLELMDENIEFIDAVFKITGRENAAKIQALLAKNCDLDDYDGHFDSGLLGLKVLKILDCSMPWLKALVLATRWGVIKLKMLELLVNPEWKFYRPYQDHFDVLSQYHDTVIRIKSNVA